MPTNLSVTDQYNEAPTGPVVGDAHTPAAYCSDLNQLTQNISFLRNRLIKTLLGSFKTFVAADIDVGTNEITLTAHGIAANTVVRYGNVGGTDMAATGMLAPDVTVDSLSTTPLYVNVVDANTITLALTSGGAAIDITNAGSGTHYLWIVPASADALMHTAFTTGAGNTIPAGALRTTLAAYYAALNGCTFTGPVTHSGAVTYSSTVTYNGVLTCNAGLTVPSGQTLTCSGGSTLSIAGTASLSGTLETTSTGIIYINSGGTFTCQGISKAYLQGKTMWPAPQRLANASHTISVHDGTRVILETPTAARTITVEQATDAPLNGERIDFELYQPGGVGTYYEIKREGSGNYIARLDGYDGGGNIMQGRCTIQFESGVWRLMGGIGLSAIGTDA